MGIIAEFKQGVSDGWKLYWSPLTGLVRKAAGIINKTEPGHQVQIAR